MSNETTKHQKFTHTSTRKRCNHELTYGMTCAEFDALLTRAQGVCEICGIAWESAPFRMLYIDHDALVGYNTVRGLLCNRCNSRLKNPFMSQPTEFVDRAEAYLANPYYVVAGITPAKKRPRTASQHGTSTSRRR